MTIYIYITTKTKEKKKTWYNKVNLMYKNCVPITENTCLKKKPTVSCSYASLYDPTITKKDKNTTN